MGASAMPVRALTVLAVVMGLLILGGFVALIVGIAGRVSHPSSVAAPARPIVPSAIELPAGARIDAMATGDGKIVLDVVQSDGNRELLIIDLASGRRLGTIPIRAAR